MRGVTLCRQEGQKATHLDSALNARILDWNQGVL